MIVPSDTPSLGVLHAPYAAATLREIHLAAMGLCQPVILFRQSVADVASDLVRAAALVGEVSVLADDPSPAQLAALNLAGLTTFKDSELEATDHWLAILGLPGAGTVSGPWDKLTQRRCFIEHEVSQLRARAVDSPSDLLIGIESLGLPAVLKPRRSSASIGLAFLRDMTDVRLECEGRSAWSGLVLEEAIPSGAHPSGAPWLADYISLETVSVGARRFHLGVMDKLPLAIATGTMETAVRETGDVLPSQLPAEVLRSVFALTDQALDSLGVTNRITHTEFRVSTDRLEIIEVNGRLGGEAARLLRMVGGPDLVRAALAVAIGVEPDLQGSCDGYAASVYPAMPNRLEAIRSDVSKKVIRAIPGVVGVDSIAVHGNLPHVNGFRAAALTLRAPDATVLARQITSVIDTLVKQYQADGLEDDIWYQLLLSRLS